MINIEGTNYDITPLKLKHYRIVIKQVDFIKDIFAFAQSTENKPPLDATPEQVEQFEKQQEQDTINKVIELVASQFDTFADIIADSAGLTPAQFDELDTATGIAIIKEVIGVNSDDFLGKVQPLIMGLLKKDKTLTSVATSSSKG